MFVVRIAAAVILVFLVSVAHAQSGVSYPAKHDRERPFYFSVYTGRTAADSTDLTLLQPQFGTNVTYQHVDWNGKPFTQSPYYGVRIGYFFPRTPRLGLEFEYNHAKMYAKVQEQKRITGVWQGQPINDVETMQDKVDEYRITNGINTLNLNLLYRFPVSVSTHYPSGRCQPYIGGGVQYYILYSINTVAGVEDTREYRPQGWGWQGFGGVRFLVTPRFGLFIEGRYQHGDGHSIIADKYDKDGGRGDTDIRIRHAIAGAFYQF